MSTNETIMTNEKVPSRMRFGFSIADVGFNIAYQTTALFIMYFFTDVFGIVPAFAGMIILLSKIWDAVTDPIMGAISDRTRSRWGKFRPYLLFGALPLGLAMFLLWQSPELSQTGKNIYSLIMYLLLSTMLTVVIVPYQASLPTLTLDSKERSSILGTRAVFSIIGTLIAAAATLPLVSMLGGENQQKGYSMMGLVYGIIIVVTTIFCFATIRERFHSSGGKEKVGVKEVFRSIVKNRPFIVLIFGVLFSVSAFSMQGAVINYFFKYNLNQEGLAVVAFAALFVAAAAGTPLFVWISKVKSKRFAYNLGMAVMAVNGLLLFLVGDINVWLTIGLFIISGVCLATNWLCPWTMVADTIEYAEWKTGLRREGIQYGIFFFIMKVASALAGFLVGTTLAISGYMANEVQSTSALLGIKISITLIPAALLVIAIVFISFFNIDAKLHSKIVEELRQGSDQ